jgi:hypothetical protein
LKKTGVSFDVEENIISHTIRLPVSLSIPPGFLLQLKTSGDSYCAGPFSQEYSKLAQTPQQFWRIFLVNVVMV